MMKNALVYGVEFDQVCRDAIKIGDIATIDQSIRTDMKAMSIIPQEREKYQWD